MTERQVPPPHVIPAELKLHGECWSGSDVAVALGGFAASPDGLFCGLEVLCRPMQDIPSGFGFPGKAQEPSDTLHVWLEWVDGATPAHILFGGGGGGSRPLVGGATRYGSRSQ